MGVIAMDKEHLYILWTSGDPDTARNMVLMYGGNSLKKGWWEKVTIVIWGSSAKLLAEDKALQKEVENLIKSGVSFEACKACADNLNAADTLENLGVTVRYWGQSLTELLNNKSNLLTV